MTDHVAEPDAVHAPKVEVFDVPAMTNTDNKGFVRPVDEYRETDFGLYMSRTADHPRFDRLELWLLPALGLRANIFHFVGGYRPEQRLYLDIGRFHGPDRSGRWHSVDWYLDLIDRPGRPLELVDVDELLQAHSAGLLTTGECEEAVAAAMHAISGAAAVDNVQTWLDGAIGSRLSWLDRPGSAG
ncbi:DUF402 domain-containing protein [Gordonia zhaorongruii]|uniref:DUF402 domain-containing protein n=1 Tax=Gordonia zhaorongruii TaxID=2597659 RepID=UPI001043E9F4|nr:DUF402 domain-containing protein [Gordonia zhaorongruii]